MSISVVYSNFTLDEANVENGSGILNTIKKDISWGTKEDKLLALSHLEKKNKWRHLEYQPEIPSQEAAVNYKGFKMKFRDEQFNFESEGVDHFIGTIAGDILKVRGIESITVEDFEFDGEIYRNFFRGPNIGVENIYKMLNKTVGKVNRPILAFSVKPRMGLTIDEYEVIYREAMKGGVDIIEDDERLIDPMYCPFEKRVELMARLQNEGNTKFSVNITGPTEKMLMRLEKAYSLGIRIVKIDVLVTGFDSLKSISDYIRDKMKGEVAITCYPDAVGSYRNLSRQFILKMARLCGVDIVYAGGPYWARLDGTTDFEKRKENNASDLLKKYNLYQVLLSEIRGFENLKSTLPTMSNDCDISYAELVQKIFLRDHEGFYQYGLFIGGGMSAFPAKLSEAIEEWLRCLVYTAGANPNDLENYKYKHRTKMEKTGLKMVNLKEEILGK